MSALCGFSLQVTRGGAQGRSLRDSVQAVRHEITEQAPESLDLFDEQLSASGWDPELPDDERWHMRNDPVVLPVDDRLPRLDMRTVPAHVRDRVRDVTYTLDVSGLPQPAEFPFELHEIRIP